MEFKNSEDVRNYAMELYKSGRNCAECVLQALIDSGAADLSQDMVRVSTGFGGGIGMYGCTCGALTGAVIGASSVHGRKDPVALGDFAAIKTELSGDNGIYKIFNNITYEFEKEIGHTSCSDIVKGQGGFDTKERAKKCQEAIGAAAEIAYRYIQEKDKTKLEYKKSVRE